MLGRILLIPKSLILFLSCCFTSLFCCILSEFLKSNLQIFCRSRRMPLSNLLLECFSLSRSVGFVVCSILFFRLVLFGLIHFLSVCQPYFETSSCINLRDVSNLILTILYWLVYTVVGMYQIWYFLLAIVIAISHVRAKLTSRAGTHGPGARIGAQ